MQTPRIGKNIMPTLRRTKCVFVVFGRHSWSSHWKRGFTLLETIIALAVITAAVVGPVSLITRGLFDFTFAKNKLIAANLAEEGIELVRVVRENNVICQGQTGWDWRRDPEPPNGNLTDNTSRDIWTETQSVGCGSYRVDMPRLSLDSGCSTILRINNGVYGYSGIAPNEEFRRCVTMSSPTTDEQKDGVTINKNDIMDIKSEVKWKERGADKSVVLYERLYNWK